MPTVAEELAWCGIGVSGLLRRLGQRGMVERLRQTVYLRQDGFPTLCIVLLGRILRQPGPGDHVLPKPFIPNQPMLVARRSYRHLLVASMQEHKVGLRLV